LLLTGCQRQSPEDRSILEVLSHRWHPVHRKEVEPRAHKVLGGKVDCRPRGSAISDAPAPLPPQSPLPTRSMVPHDPPSASR